MTTAATPVEQLPRITRGREAWQLATAVYDALLALLKQLEPEEWDARTVCAPWTVADMVGHVIGAAESEATLRAGVGQQIAAERRKGAHGGSSLDAWTAAQVESHADLTPAQRLSALRAAAPLAVRGRSRLPALLGRMPVPLPTVGSVPAGSPTALTLGELNTVIYTRDTWLHRIDIARATGYALALDAAVDGRIVADVVADWAGRHGQPFHLDLTGPAGGSYRQGSGGPRISMDAIDLCWILSGRAEPEADQPGAALLRTRVLF